MMIFECGSPWNGSWNQPDTPRSFLLPARSSCNRERLSEAACLITDVRMPGIDGLELQRRIRLVRPQVPVIFLTAHYDEDTRRQALHGGAIAFIHKPFDTSTLLSLIERAVNESRSE